MLVTLEFQSVESAERYARKAKLSDFMVLFDDFEGSYGVYFQWQRGSWARLKKRVKP